MTSHNQPPLQYYANVPMPGRRPASITTLAILGIIFGAFTTIAMPFSLFGPNAPGASDDPIDRAMRESSGALAVTNFSTIMSGVLGIALLIGSIGALSVKPWARRLINIYGITSIIGVLAWLILHYIYVAPAITLVASKLAPAEAQMITLGINVAVIVGALLSIGMPILDLIFFNTQKAKTAFSRGRMWNGGGYPQQPGYPPQPYPQQPGYPQPPGYPPQQGHPPQPPPGGYR